MSSASKKNRSSLSGASNRFLRLSDASSLLRFSKLVFLSVTQGKKGVFCVLLFLALFSSRSVMAHKVVADVYATDGVVEGEIGFSDGRMARDALVGIFAESGEKLGEVRTDANGFFAYRFPSVQALSFRADLSAGHLARADLAAGDLSAGRADGNAGQKPSTGVSSGLRRDILNLRKDIAALRAERCFQDILGGIGFIFGLFGIAAFVMGRQKWGRKK